MALTRMFNLAFQSSSFFLEKSFGLGRSHCEFYSEIFGWNKVEMLFYLNLSTSLTTISRPRLLSKLATVLNDRYILHLLSSFLSLPVLDEDG